MKNIIWVALASTLLLACASERVDNQARVEAKTPELTVTLRPYGVIEVEGIEVELEIVTPDIAAGEPLLRMPVVLVGTPTAAYEADDVYAADEHDRLELTSTDEEPTASGMYRRYVASRDTTGNVQVRYRTAPRAVDQNTRNGPLFDIRPQNGGFMGAGVYFMLLPGEERDVYQVTLNWDFSLAPEGTTGTWSLGEGTQQFVRPLQNLRFAFYAAGNVQRADADPDASFNMYWISQPPFNMDLLAGNIVKLFSTMAEFHGKPDEEYRVFIRSNPHKGGGGTGFVDSFAFSFGTDDDSPEDGPLMLLAHEIAHNWTGLNGADEPHALTAWYSEGTAEFYKVTMAYRAGLIDRERVLSELNSMAEGYYSNPYINASNEEAGEFFWQDGLAQRVPYGRGFMYLMSTDERIRQATNGQYALDDLVLTINRLQSQGERVGNERWQALLAGYIGDAAYDYHQAMVSGELIIPPETTFGPCLRVEESLVRPFQLGFDRMNLGTVTGLETGSNAAVAGLKENDSIVRFTPLRHLRNNETAEMTITVVRDGAELEITYLPRGEEIQAWKWVNTDAPDEACQF